MFNFNFSKFRTEYEPKLKRDIENLLRNFKVGSLGFPADHYLDEAYLKIYKNEKQWVDDDLPSTAAYLFIVIRRLIIKDYNKYCKKLDKSSDLEFGDLVDGREAVKNHLIVELASSDNFRDSLGSNENAENRLKEIVHALRREEDKKMLLLIAYEGYSFKEIKSLNNWTDIQCNEFKRRCKYAVEKTFLPRRAHKFDRL